MLDPYQEKKDFPIFLRRIHGKPLIYLDNAATTQKPRVVLDAISSFYRTSNANVHRGVHLLSEAATAQYEGAREHIRRFIGARSRGEVIFTRNATEGLNLVARMLESQVKVGDEIWLSEMEHHSNLVPWQQLAKRRRAKLRFIPITESTELDVSFFQKHITRKAKIVSVAHASNVLGTINSIEEIAKIAHRKGVLVVVDAAQTVGHLPVDVQNLGADFLVFSGHKMCGPTGIGVLWGREELLENLEPVVFGGDMILKVTYQDATWNKLPWKFEPGTPNVAGAIGLGAAVLYLESIGMKKIRAHEQKLTRYALRILTNVPDLRIYGPQNTAKQTGVTSFTFAGIHPHDIASILDREGIAIRSGHHCAMPLMGRLGIPAAARASMYLYNSEEDIDRLAVGLEKVRNVFHKPVAPRRRGGKVTA